jgi:hypothetical protein
MFLIILGCSPSSEKEKDTTTLEEPLAYEYEAEEGEAALDIALIEEGVNEALSLLRTYNSREIVSAYYDVMSYADAQCPTSYEIDGNAFWYGACTSEQGLDFDGYLFFNTYADSDLFSDGTLWDAEIINGSTDLHHDEQGRTHFGGNVYLAEGVNADGADVFLSAIQGSFLVESSAEAWLKDGWSPLLTLYGLRKDTPLGGANALSINGSMPFDTSGVQALSFSDILISQEEFGYPCPQEPIGVLSVRSKEGIWLDITFDVGEDWTLTGICDGCGMAQTETGEEYEVCIDAQPLLDWEEQPW